MIANRWEKPLSRAIGVPFVALFLALWAGLAAASDVHPVKHGEGRLWRVERPGGPPSHIMGTIHVADPRVRDLPVPIREAFESSRRAAFELLPDPEVRQTVQQAQRLPTKKSLAKLLDKDTYRKTLAVAARYGLPAEAVDQMQPWALAILFQTPPDEFRRRLDGDLILDAWLIQWAYDLGMRVVALEKPEEQMSLFDAFEPRDQVEMLREILTQLEEEPNGVERLIDDYLDGSMTAAYRRVEEMARADKEPGARQFKELFLDARNHTMVRRMIPLLQEGHAFVAVGALHMPGEEGILNLLERRGYRVTRLY
ncbi:TraB/GumN family protein [Pelagibius sp.]|uniref:TraB/GumN family protein n=1 Tax=Pelagibius sp. TaxID=1931238 RepID=UPI0026202454|nr:TraB/GumN family protein [Pelagibius sp.]